QSRRQSGCGAERLAAQYLKTRGLELLARNLRCKGGELDLVCRDGEVLVMVEVRQRGRRDFGGALASVTLRKQRRIIRATRFMLDTVPGWRSLRLRFDVIGVQGRPDGAHEVVWVKDAFRAT
ncbi:MAG: YraN family protein, partial [Steroidobacteraceae bacterium]